MNPIARLLQSLRQDGIRPTATRVVEGLAWRTAPVWQWPGNRMRRLRLLADAKFDRKHGVDTGGSIAIRNLDVSDVQKEAGFHYEATPEAALRAMLGSLRIEHEKFTFIDYGSGKGRVLLLASEYPYRRIVGVEASRQLNDIALRNFKRWQNRKQRCFQLESYCMDARDFSLPEDPLVLFFFTPFRPPISNQVVDRVRESLAAHPRPMRIVHYGTNEDFRQLLATLGFTRTAIYSARPFSAQHNYTGTLFSSRP